MKIAIIGITGRAGSRIATELLARGHQVTGIARDSSKAAAQPGLALHNGDASQPATLAPLLAGHDAVISSTRFDGSDANQLLQAVHQAGVPRLLVVGGAGSLEIAPGKALVDAEGFPAAYKAEALGGRAFLNRLREEKSLAWTFLSPSAEFNPGERTGHFRLGGDQLLADANGKSHVSMEDYAIALADEVETPRHTGKRFTVGY
ncbi:NAD(P)-dependent oxidoreductase [Xylophilus sp. GW821-FHT01B05]